MPQCTSWASALLDHLGGSVLVNLASVGFAALALWSVFMLVQRDGGRWPGGRCSCWRATRGSGSRPPRSATSSGPSASCWPVRCSRAARPAVRRAHAWTSRSPALARARRWRLMEPRPARAAPPSRWRRAEPNRAVAGWTVERDAASGAGRPVLAGVLFGLAIGCRASSALLVLAWCAAELDRSGRLARARASSRLGGRHRAAGRHPLLRAAVVGRGAVARLHRQRAGVRRLRRAPRPVGGEEPGPRRPAGGHRPVARDPQGRWRRSGAGRPPRSCGSRRW